MRAIDLYCEGNVINYRYSEIKDGIKRSLPARYPVHTIIETMEKGNISNIKEVNNDIMFVSNNHRVIIRNYKTSKYLSELSTLANNIDISYRREKLRKRKVKRQALITRVIIISGVVAIGLVGIKTKLNGKTENTPIDIDDEPAIESNEELEDEPQIYIVSPSDSDSNTDEKQTIESNNMISSEQSNIEEQTPDYENSYIHIEFDNRTSSDKAIKTKELYGNIIEKYANTYGVDSNLMLALATQERGEHSNIVDEGGGFGLMQIQQNVWDGESLTVYNYNLNDYETIEINESMMQDLEGNIKLGCAIMQDNLTRLGNNPLMALQAYNYGVPYVESCVDACAIENNLSHDEIINDYTNTDWMYYRNTISDGDQEYIENVLSYMGDKFEITHQTKNGEVKIGISNQNQKVYQ